MSIKAWTLLFDAIRALKRENQEVLYASLVKDTMRRKRPSFTESAYGYDSFSDMLEDVRDAGFIELREDERVIVAQALAKKINDAIHHL